MGEGGQENSSPIKPSRVLFGTRSVKGGNYLGEISEVKKINSKTPSKNYKNHLFGILDLEWTLFNILSAPIPFTCSFL